MVKGRCHICKAIKDVEYCSICKHYLCKECEDDWISRGKEALKVLLKKLSGSGSSDGRCCGPV